MQSLPERDADIFDGVMVVDVMIALGGDVQAEAAMAGNVIEHMIEKAHACLQLRSAAVGGIEIQLDANVGFLGRARDGGGALGHAWLTVMNSNERSVCE